MEKTDHQQQDVNHEVQPATFQRWQIELKNLKETRKFLSSSSDALLAMKLDSIDSGSFLRSKVNSNIHNDILSGLLDVINDTDSSAFLHNKLLTAIEERIQQLNYQIAEACFFIFASIYEDVLSTGTAKEREKIVVLKSRIGRFEIESSANG